MSKYEKMFVNYLNTLGIKYVYQYPIANCPFTRSGIHNVDFYIPSKDLYIEIKGNMTLYTVNQLLYLSQFTGKSFYILQMSEEDWITPYDPKIHKNKRNKITANIAAQFKELTAPNIHAQVLSLRSLQRLYAYIAYRKGDIARWI